MVVMCILETALSWSLLSPAPQNGARSSWREDWVGIKTNGRTSEVLLKVGAGGRFLLIVLSLLVLELSQPGLVCSIAHVGRELGGRELGGHLVPAAGGLRRKINEMFELDELRGIRVEGCPTTRTIQSHRQSHRQSTHTSNTHHDYALAQPSSRRANCPPASSHRNPWRGL